MPHATAATLDSFISDSLPLIHRAADGERALALLRDLVATDRWNSFDRFNDTTRTLVAAYERAGAAAEVTPIQTGAPIGSGRWVIQEAADVHGATLDVVAPVEQRLADYHECPWHIAQCSSATPVEGLRGELVVIDDPDRVKRLAPGELRGRFVLTRLPVRPWVKSFADAGAAVVINDPPVRNLPDAVRWVKLGWGGMPLRGGPTRLVGFALSANQGKVLRELHESRGPVTLHAHADIRRYVGTHDVISGLVRGRERPDEEIWCMAHTAEPGALDNASGVTVCVEIAHALESLIADGAIPRPRRTIRFVNGYECYGFFGYLEQRGVYPPALAGVNIDDVGQRPELCFHELDWHATVPMSAGFVDRVGERILRGALELDDVGYRYTPKPFASTSDTLIGDPRYGFPCPWITTAGPRHDAYHSSADTPDRVSPRGLRLIAAAMAGYLHYLADAGEPEALELAESETRRFADQLDAHGDDPWRARYLHDQHRASLDRLERWLASGAHAPARAQLDALRRQIAERMPPLPELAHREGSERVPRRTALLAPTLENTPPPIARRIRGAELWEWAHFWADGRRSLGEIAQMLRIEGGCDVSLEQVTEFFEAHEELGYVSFD